MNETKKLSIPKLASSAYPHAPLGNKSCHTTQVGRGATHIALHERRRATLSLFQANTCKSVQNQC
jgi:hypothetical protein